jgi:nucleotide-binding universal stress UspA family protein
MTEPAGLVADMHVVISHADETAAALAVTLARQLDAHLTGLALSFVPVIPFLDLGYATTTPIPTEAFVAMREEAVADATRAAATFVAMAKAAGLRFDSYVLTSMVGDALFGTISHLRVSDLVVIGQTNSADGEALRKSLIEASLFEAAAPTLVAPGPAGREVQLKRAMIAWDGSASASRAVRAALPLLRRVNDVVVLMVSEAKQWMDRVPGADIGVHLARHGLRVEVKRVDNAAGDVASTLLQVAADEGAGILVMGAYGHSRMREFILGGATRGMLSQMTLPVLMAH